MTNQLRKIASTIEKATGVPGHVDFLTLDGFGFTPESNDDTHVLVSEIIQWAENGENITEEFILDRLYF